MILKLGSSRLKRYISLTIILIGFLALFLASNLHASENIGKLAFVLRRNDGSEKLYVINSDGSNLRILAEGCDGYSFPSWSPKGNLIAFSSSCDYQTFIFTLNLDNSTLRRLTDKPGARSPLWSPDGQKIYYWYAEDMNNLEIYVIDVDGRNARNLTNNNAWDQPSDLSPDGKRIVFFSAREEPDEVFVMDSDGKNVYKLLAGYGYEAVAWSIDSTKIIYDLWVNGNSDIFIINDNSSYKRNLTNHPAYDRFLAWSPDGEQLAFISDRDGDFTSYIMSVDGGEAHRLVENMFIDNVTWSPDGAKIAFNSMKDIPQIFVSDVDGRNVMQLTNFTDSFRIDGIIWQPQ